MTEDDLRALVRAAIQRHLHAGAPDPAASSGVFQHGGGAVPMTMAFGQYRLERDAGDTTCIIEPAVACNHCGFCKSHGH